MRRPGLAVQWGQLLVMSLAHGVADMFANMLPVILPALREHFTMTLTVGGLVASACILTSNLVQVLTGHTRADKTTPTLLYIGLGLSAAVCFIYLLPQTGLGIGMAVTLSAVSGAGIAFVHPEGLRAIHGLDRIRPGIATAVFMMGGFIGFSAGGAISAECVEYAGLAGLKWITLGSVVTLALVLLSRVRLAVEEDTLPETDTPIANHVAPVKRVRFWPLMAVAVPAGLSTTILCMLMPTRLEELGFELTWGGYSAFAYGIGAAGGAFILAWLAHHTDELRLTVITLLAAPLILTAYLLTMSHRAAIILLIAQGFCAMGSYILLITLARYAVGPNLGRRMGFIVGGTWGVSVSIFMLLVPVAEHFGTPVVLYCAVVGYLVSAGAAVRLMKQPPPPPSARSTAKPRPTPAEIPVSAS